MSARGADRLIRYGFVCPAILAVLAVTYIPRFHCHLQPILSLLITFGCLGIVLMIPIAPFYYPGITLDGCETYRRILQFRPCQKAIIASGFSESDRVKEAQRLGAGEYVRKPYTLDRIARALRAELNRRTG